MKVQHMKFGMLSAVLVVCTLMISTIDLSQNFVFAQSTTSTLIPSQTTCTGQYLHTIYTQLLVVMMNHRQATIMTAMIVTLMKLPDSSGSADDANNSEDSDSQQDATSN